MIRSPLRLPLEGSSGLGGHPHRQRRKAAVVLDHQRKVVPHPLTPSRPKSLHRPADHKPVQSVEWRRSPRSSSDPNRGSWRGRRPAGYEVVEGTPRRTALYLGTQECQQVGEQDNDN